MKITWVKKNIQKINLIYRSNCKSTFSTFTFQNLQTNISERGQLPQKHAQQHLVHPPRGSLALRLGKWVGLTFLPKYLWTAEGTERSGRVVLDCHRFYLTGYVKYFLAESCEVRHLRQSLTEYSSRCLGT